MMTAQAALDDLRKLSPDIRAAVVLGPSGEVMALSASKAVADAMAPLIMTLTSVAARSCQELGRGAMQMFVVEAALGLVVGQDLGSGQVLAAVAARPGRLGLLLDDVRACGLRVAQLNA
jgi:predicted regulator of Ras-like GTPase activity (Roadblock/LC7/MglB family)